jgi:hypothetical protein
MASEDRMVVFSEAPELSTGRDIDLIRAFERKHGPMQLGVWDTAVMHDEDCPRLSGAGSCTCEVEVVLTNLEDGRQVQLKWAESGDH